MLVELSKTWRQKWWTPSYEWHDFGAVGIFVVLALGSIALGAYRAYAGHEGAVLALLGSELTLLSLFATALIFELATVRERAGRARGAARKSRPTLASGK
jgi:hypothetical protein